MRITKIVITLILTSLLTILNALAQDSIVYIMKSGVVAGKYNINTQVDSIIFYKPDILPVNSFTDDRDGKIYKTTVIGNQVWMAENLAYLPSVVGPDSNSTATPFYYVYGYYGTNVTEAKATANYNLYGVLYNWPAAMNGAASSTENPSGVQGVCPEGWHLPSHAEWMQLTDYYLGGEGIAGGKLKDIGTNHWISPNAEATNETGFNALPGGYRFIFWFNGTFYNMGYNGYWWSSTTDIYNDNDVWYRKMRYDYGSVERLNGTKQNGLSVRCVMD